MSKDDETNAIKRLSIFDSETQQFKNEQIYKLLTRSDRMNLEATRLISKEIDTLLLRIFDLSNIQKNQLLMYSKEYRELIQEQATINKLQNK